MDTRLFDYDLPSEAIAQTPAARRDESRLLFVDRATGSVNDLYFSDLPDLIRRRTALIRNNAKVLKARLFGHRDTGGKVECLLLHPTDNLLSWWCLIKPAKKLPVGARFSAKGYFNATIETKSEEGLTKVLFELAPPFTDVWSMSEQIGKVPLPPYIQRDENDPRDQLDRERYDTIYADPSRIVAAAAPTAGLHFTPEVIQQTESNGHKFFDLTLHVGLDTFRPIAVDQIEAHKIHTEHYELPSDTRKLLHSRGQYRTLAVGTTALRAAEAYCRSAHHEVSKTNWNTPFHGTADLFIYPPAQFNIDALLTNFHLPRSTLMCLVSAFLTPGSTDGIEWLIHLYKSALSRGYRFYSYGDAMLIL